MSTATMPTTEPTVIRHTKVLGNTRFWCIQPECDLKHHVWCSCEHRAPTHAH